MTDIDMILFLHSGHYEREPEGSRFGMSLSTFCYGYRAFYHFALPPSEVREEGIFL